MTRKQLANLRFWILVLGLMSVFLATAHSVYAGSEKEPIVIHSPAGLTGPWAYVMKPQFQGYQTCFKYINEVEGGIEGHPIKLVWADSSYDPTKTMSLYKRWKAAGRSDFPGRKRRRSEMARRSRPSLSWDRTIDSASPSTMAPAR